MNRICVIAHEKPNWEDKQEIHKHFCENETKFFDFSEDEVTKQTWVSQTNRKLMGNAIHQDHFMTENRAITSHFEESWNKLLFNVSLISLPQILLVSSISHLADCFLLFLSSFTQILLFASGSLSVSGCPARRL